jgi:hypothetical protein
VKSGRRQSIHLEIRAGINGVLHWQSLAIPPYELSGFHSHIMIRVVEFCNLQMIYFARDLRGTLLRWRSYTPLLLEDEDESLSYAVVEAPNSL